jgi:hypothetical protein
MAECPSCGDEFDRLGLHWWHGSCPYPELTDMERDIFIGLLMGDGSIPDRKSDTSIFHIPMINRRFLSWLDTELGILTTGVRLKKTAAELAENNRNSGFSPEAAAENYHDMYTVWTRSHVFFDKLRDDWYQDGKKKFPDTLRLTPERAKFWYLSDGYLDIGQWGRPRLEIKTRNENERGEHLVSLFESEGFCPVFRRNELRFTCDDTERLLSWMGSPPPGFEYKWELESRDKYRALKEKAYEEYTTRTIE